MNLKYTVDTKIDSENGDIIQSVTNEFNDVQTVLFTTITKTRDEQIKNALISLGWTPPKEQAKIPSSSKCLVSCCQNHRHEGTFIGDICGPCFQMITTGIVGRGHTFIKKLSDDLDMAKHDLECIKKNTILYSEIRSVFENALDTLWKEKNATDEQPVVTLPKETCIGRLLVCEKCGGEGWLWGTELLNPSEDTQQDTQTQYSCDRCNGTGLINKELKNEH